MPGRLLEAWGGWTWPSPTPAFQLRGDERQPAKGRRSASRPTPDEAEEQRFVCASCHHSVTRSSWAVEQAGSHKHTFLNPAGFVFHIGCFAEAPGVTPSGERSVEFTWFPGHGWQIVVCGGCGEQLGWHFEAQEQAFFGLVLARLREQSTAGPAKS